MIIGLSGKIGVGKDTVGKIIQIITQSPHFNDDAVINFLERDLVNPKFVNKKFADTLKDFICMLLGCTRERLEDRDFKESYLGLEWDKYRIIRKGYNNFYVNTEEEALLELGKYVGCRYVKVQMTPRLLLQLMGTECGREILHPNIWVNALMSNYIHRYSKMDVLDMSAKRVKTIRETPESNWIITDMRFPNELKAVEERKGVTIRINRDSYPNMGEENYEFKDGNHVWYDNKERGHVFSIKEGTKESSLFEFRKMVSMWKQRIKNVPQHASETALDNSTFKYVIENSGTLNDLVKKVRQILKKEELI